jgi:cation:H+ antiporter
MILAILAVAAGLFLLVWSADRFVEGAAVTAHYLGMPPLLIGMVIVGFGTSAPEMVVSAMAALQGNPGMALGNAYGSNIANLGLILGLAALVRPITVRSRILRRELPILTAATALGAFQIWNGVLTRFEAFVLLGTFAALMAWTIRQGMRENADALKTDVEVALETRAMSRGRAGFRLVAGLLLLTASSRLLVWGGVSMAYRLGISDLIIGLTIVAIGTSLPELASSIAAVRQGQCDLALGNVLGSNLFNTLAVVGIAGAIHPMAIGPEVLTRDLPVMALFTISLFVIGFGFRGPGRINRLEGLLLLGGYLSYTTYLIFQLRIH